MSEPLERRTGEVSAAATATADPWDPIRRLTQARIGLQRTGNGVCTTDVLRFQADHAAARDAVHTPMNAAAVAEGLRGLGLGEPVTVSSRASSRAEYLRRPDLGRLPDDLSAVAHSGADIGIVVGDGLSATAVDVHAVSLVAAIAAGLSPAFTIAPPILASQARVALGDHVGEALGVETLIMIIGERPGLSVADSLGVYLTYAPRPGRRDSERNCISNIHPPEGLGYEQAAKIVHGLVEGARKLGASGVTLKNTSSSPDSLPPSTETP